LEEVERRRKLRTGISYSNALLRISPLFSVSSVLFFSARAEPASTAIPYSAMPRRTSSLNTMASETSFIDLRRWRLCR